MEASRCQLSPVYLEGVSASLHGFVDSNVQYVLFSELHNVVLPHIASSTLQRRKREVLAASPAGEQQQQQQHKCPAAYLQLYKQAGLLKPDARQADVLTVQQASLLMVDLSQRGRVSCPFAVAASSSAVGDSSAAGSPPEPPSLPAPEAKRHRPLVADYSSGDDKEEDEDLQELQEEEGEEGQVVTEPEELEVETEVELDGEGEASVQEVVHTYTTTTDMAAPGGAPRRKPRSLRLDTHLYPTLHREIAQLCRALASGGKGGPPMPQGTTASGLAPSTVKKTRERVEGERASSMHTTRTYTACTYIQVHVPCAIVLHVCILIYPPLLISHNSLPRLRVIPESTATTRTGGRGRR